MHIDDAAVILHLLIRVKPENLDAFRAYIRDAFPVFERGGDCRGAVYQDARDPERFDEVFYYRTEAAYQEGERGIREEPEQIALLARWRTLLEGPPEVVVQRRFSPIG